MKEKKFIITVVAVIVVVIGIVSLSTLHLAKGTYADPVPATGRVLISSISAGSYCTTPTNCTGDSSDSDNNCCAEDNVVTCPAGSYCVNGGKTPCSEDRDYQDSTGKSSCKTCPEDQYRHTIVDSGYTGCNYGYYCGECKKVNVDGVEKWQWTVDDTKTELVYGYQTATEECPGAKWFNKNQKDTSCGGGGTTTPPGDTNPGSDTGDDTGNDTGTPTTGDSTESPTANNATATSTNNASGSTRARTNVTVNQPTGTAWIVIAWGIGISAIVYSFWYFRKIK